MSQHNAPVQPCRREFLRRAWNGFAMLPFAHLLQPRNAAQNGGAIVRHHAPRVRNVIFLYMDGGPSQVDTFDYKPRLQQDDGKPFAMPKSPTQFNNNGNTLGSPWKFRQRGQSGLWVSDVLPHLAEKADRLCVVRSMTSEFSEHTNANYFLHTGSGLQGRPSMGAWVAYGLGSENQNLPAYVVLNGGLIPPGGSDNFHSGFLPAQAQASMLRMRGEPLANITPHEKEQQQQRRKLDLLDKLDRHTLAATNQAGPIAAAIKNQELAFRMQTAVPELFNLHNESASLQRLYGMASDYEPTRSYGRQCLLARRLVERGVRFVQLTCMDTGHDRWDQHDNLRRGLEDNCRMVDQPIAALLTDLASRGLLDETLVVWGGEFGRTPFAQGKDGRDHNPFGFTMWLAGGGTKAGFAHGETDDYGYRAVVDPVSIHDLHATILYLLGINHEQFTYRFGGRDMRLTDVFGKVQTQLLA
ncbi:MAG: DUF1501 domain-containing protein [Planctomycetota bacterium]|nr:DUF1501 domain-containing protein [Planctomycetota bacterium]